MKSFFLSVAFGSFLLLGLSGCRHESAPAAAASEVSVVTTNAPMAVAAITNAYEFLKGKWQRPDGGYILEVRTAGADGQLEAGYFNPSPIKVSQARASQDAGSVKVFVELRDVNYPGCTYKLTYDTKTDQLFGQYFQAAMQETYDVTFGREK